MSDALAQRRERALALFRRSLLKREKLRQIEAQLGTVAGRHCLDIGADNGVISLLLRRNGGTWISADLDPRTVESIRSLVGDPVHRLDGGRTPFDDGTFDTVVVVDFLEHIEDDRGFVRELARILRPGGALLVNVPHVKPRSLLNRLRRAIGQTDARHGHVRPGYTRASLAALLEDGFELEQGRTYSRFFSEAIDTALHAAWDLSRRSATKGPASRKGPVITGDDLAARPAGSRALALAWPVLRAVAALDRLLFLQPGYKLIVRAVRRP